MPPKPQQAHAKAKESKAGGTVTPAVDITYKIQAVSITVRGAICEKEKYSEGDRFELLPAPASDEMAFKIFKYGVKERIYRIRLPADASQAAVVKELMTGKSWSICAVYNTPTTLLATYKGVYLSLPLAPFLLDACAPTPPLAPAEAIIAALQPHITDLVLRFAIDSSLQALRAALASRAFAAGVKQWMHTPRVETIKVSWFPKGTFRDEEQWTGLPRALHLQTTLTTPDEAAALVALLRAAVRPAPDVAKRLEDAYDEDIMEASMYMSVPDFARTHYLRFAAGKLKGLPGVTFVWSDYGCYVDDCSEHVSGLYLLEGTSATPPFRPILVFTSGEMEEQPDLHLSNFISLRSRLRAAFPSLNPLSDYALLTVLTEAVAHAAPTDEYALVRLMPGHPERGDGQPATVAEREAVRRNMKVPENVGTSAGGNRPPRAYCGGMLPFTSVRGMGVPLLESRRLFPAVKEAMAVIDPFHRGGGGH